jgi:type I restriction enzyme, S subunit
MYAKVIPSGWNRYLLRDICDVVQYGYTASAQQRPIGPKFLRITDIVPELIDWNDVPHCEIEIKKADNFLLRTGDIVVARTGATSGYAKWIKEPPPSVFASYLVRLRIKPKYDNRFVGMVVQSNIYKDFITANLSGAAQPQANAQVITSFPILMPPLASQHHITDILSAYDDLIENNTRRIRILEQMAQAIYQEWFGKMDTEPLPEGWEFVALEDVCSRITDGSHSSPPSVEMGFPMASVKDMNSWDFDICSCRTISDADYHQLVRMDCKPLLGDVVIAKDGSYLKHVFVIQEEREMAILSSIAILRPNHKISPQYLTIHLQDPMVKARMANYVSGAALPRIILKDFKKFKILLPDKETLHDFTSLVIPIFELTFKLFKQNTNLRQTRDLLLPRLVSGEIDVSSLS